MSKSKGYEHRFLYAQGEPAIVACDNGGKARSVWSAIHVFQVEHPEQWIEMAREIFKLRGPRDAALLQAEGVMAEIEDTASFEVPASASEPMKVYIDKGKRFAVEVWR